jgi:hypothetical protein
MTRDELECVVEDMLLHTRGMSRREQAGAVVNSVFWPELMKVIRERDEARRERDEARALALDEVLEELDGLHETPWSSQVIVNKCIEVVRELKDRAP